MEAINRLSASTTVSFWAGPKAFKFTDIAKMSVNVTRLFGCLTLLHRQVGLFIINHRQNHSKEVINLSGTVNCHANQEQVKTTQIV